jgi:uncharacterized protein
MNHLCRYLLLSLLLPVMVWARQVPAPQEMTIQEPLASQIAEAIRLGNFAEAYYWWRPLAEVGITEAEYGLGWMYHNGYGLAINDLKALYWWERAAEHGHTEATFAVAMLYYRGEGPIPRDRERGILLFGKAASMGHDEARLLLQSLAEMGNDHARSAIWQMLESQPEPYSSSEDIALLTQLAAWGIDGAKEQLASLRQSHPERFGEPITIVSDKANLRSGRATSNPVVEVIKGGEQVLVLKRDGDWWQVMVPESGNIGWMHKSLFREKTVK